MTSGVWHMPRGIVTAGSQSVSSWDMVDAPRVPSAQLARGQVEGLDGRIAERDLDVGSVEGDLHRVRSGKLWVDEDDDGQRGQDREDDPAQEADGERVAVDGLGKA